MSKRIQCKSCVFFLESKHYKGEGFCKLDNSYTREHRVCNKEIDNFTPDPQNHIKMKAEQGETVLHLYKTISYKTADLLRSRGFKVIDQPSITIQKDGLHFSIYWDSPKQGD